MDMQTKCDLTSFLHSYDVDGSGKFDRARWLHLCTSATINLPRECAADLFDRLDTDRDGIVTIHELLRNLNEWQMNVNESLPPRSSESRSMRRPPGLTLNGEITDAKTTKRLDSFYESSPYDNDQELGKSLKEARTLNKLIKESYPELSASFHNLLESFKNDIRHKTTEQEDLQESYKREKIARKEDLERLELELDTQIKMVEEQLRTDISKKYEAEYRAKVREKEQEIESFKERVNELGGLLKRRRSTTSALQSVNTSTTIEGNTPARQTVPIAMGEEVEKESVQLRQNLRDAQLALRQSESELAQLRDTIETQSSQLFLEKMRASSYIEEKDLLYNHIQKLREALREMQMKYSANSWNATFDMDFYPQNGIWLKDSGNSSNSIDNSDKQFIERSFRPESSITNLSTMDNVHDPDRVFRVVIVGDSGVGKTCFMHRFCTGDFCYSARATIGIDIKTKNILVDGNTYTVEIWDTAGQERYRSLANHYFRKCDGAVLMYDVSNGETFLNIREWIDLLENNCIDGVVPCVLVANKTDLRENSRNNSSFISTEQGNSLAQTYNTAFLETSVLNYVNVEEVITNLTRAMKNSIESQRNGVRITNRHRKIKKHANCC